MHACYPDQVDGDNPVSPVELFGYPSPFGTVVWPRRWQVSEDTGATQCLTPRGSVIIGGTMEESRVRRVSLEQC
jgi:hypothetical protein